MDVGMVCTNESEKLVQSQDLVVDLPASFARRNRPKALMLLGIMV
jgi:hypothetical protein